MLYDFVHVCIWCASVLMEYDKLTIMVKFMFRGCLLLLSESVNALDQMLYTLSKKKKQIYSYYHVHVRLDLPVLGTNKIQSLYFILHFYDTLSK